MEKEYKSINPNYNLLFVEYENEYDDWEERLISAINTKDWEAFIALEKERPQIKELYLQEDSLIHLIREYTLEKTLEEKQDILKMIESSDFVQEIESVNDLGFRIRLKDQSRIAIMQATKLIWELKEDPYILTKERYGNCHGASKAYLDIFEDSKLITGYVCSLADKNRYLHSWIETSMQGKEFVFDYTMNVMINTEGYYRLFHVQKINEIEKEEIVTDRQKGIRKKLAFQIGEELYDFDDKTYLTCAQEIKKELKNKNKVIYDEIFGEER